MTSFSAAAKDFVQSIKDAKLRDFQGLNVLDAGDREKAAAIAAENHTYYQGVIQQQVTMRAILAEVHPGMSVPAWGDYRLLVGEDEAFRRVVEQRLPDYDVQAAVDYVQRLSK